MRAFCVPPIALCASTAHPRLPRTCPGSYTNESTFGRRTWYPCSLAWGRRFGGEKSSRKRTWTATTHRETETRLWVRESSAKLAVLASGGGRSLQNICEKIEAGALTGCEVSLVIASKRSAGAIEKAERFGIPIRVLRLKDFERSTELFSDAISNMLDEYEVDLVVLAGWMHFYLIPPRYEGRVINIHPSLIPAFCGKGYYGHHVHQAVLDFGAKVTGCTVHLADNEYDHGPIILQKPVAVHECDTADDLAARVFETEKEALPEAIQLFVDGKLCRDGKLVRVKSTPISNNV